MPQTQRGWSQFKESCCVKLTPNSNKLFSCAWLPILLPYMMSEDAAFHWSSPKRSNWLTLIPALSYMMNCPTIAYLWVVCFKLDHNNNEWMNEQTYNVLFGGSPYRWHMAWWHLCKRVKPGISCGFRLSIEITMQVCELAKFCGGYLNLTTSPK